MRHSSGASDLWMKYQPVTSVRQWFGVSRDDRHSGSLVQPSVRRRDACLSSKTVDCHGTLTRRHREINQQRRAALSTKHLVKPHDAALAGDELVTGLLPQSFENWIQGRILKFLRDNCAFQIEKTTCETEPFKVAVVITGNHQAALRACVARCFLEIFQVDVLREVFFG